MIHELEHAIRNKYHWYHHYKQLEQQTDDTDWKQIVHHMVEDEKSHYEMFQQLYYLQAGRYVTQLTKPEPFSATMPFLHEAWKNELEAADTYKTLVLRYRTPQQATPFWIAMHDEMEHAIRLQGYMHWFNERS